jgi:hypothetical protein
MFSLRHFQNSQNKPKHWTRLINQLKNFKFQMLGRWLTSQEGFNIKCPQAYKTCLNYYTTSSVQRYIFFQRIVLKVQKTNSSSNFVHSQR